MNIKTKRVFSFKRGWVNEYEEISAGWLWLEGVRVCYIRLDESY